MTYDRAVVKPNLNRIAAVNRGDFSSVPPPPITKVIVPTSEEQGREWRYSTVTPAADWFKPEFDDRNWPVGQAGFGTKRTPGTVVRTEWNTPDIWLRTEFKLTTTRFTSLHFRMHHDDDAEVYINGIPAGTMGDYSREYEEISVPSAGLKVLKSGVNVIAVHCRQIRGGQYIDLGLVDLLPAKKKQ
jgi:hypothetical protein